jgi:type I restriction enzyme S subunit
MSTSAAVRDGYKQTDVGVIPEDWIVAELEDICRETITYGIVQCGPHIESGVPYIRVSDMNHPDLDVSGMLRTSPTIAAQFSRSMVREGDIVYALRGKIGEVRRVDSTVAGANLTQGTARLSANSRVDADYLLWSMRSQRALRQGDLAAKGSTFREITLEALRKIQLPISPLPEQRAIAAALSDVDALLAKLDAFIAKKRDLKQAAMQQLLTGATRLPGFTGAWEVKRLGDVGDIAGSGVDKKIRPHESPIRLLNYMDVYREDFIYSEGLDHWVTASPNQARRCVVQKGDVFFTPSSETRDDIARTAVAMESIGDAAYSYHVVRLRLKEPWDLRFRAYAFKTRAFLAQAETQCDGSGTRYVISLGKFRNLTVVVPPLNEQSAIASILSTMDNELAILTARRDKTRALKHGTMQELLTGRIRLI